MKKQDFSKLLEGVDIEKVIKESLGKKKPIDESYVSEPKAFNQTSESVSEKTKKAHYDLYKGYLEASNDVSAKLDSVSRNVDEVNSFHSNYRSLKLDETYNLNAKWLHELFFANCFDPYSEIYMQSLAYMRLQREWGTFDDWQSDFMACAMSCGNGWAVCGYNVHLQRYVNTIVSNNSQDVMVGLYPVIVLDCVEHSYARDYANDKKSYIVAMMREINWNVVEERFQKSESIAEVLKK